MNTAHDHATDFIEAPDLTTVGGSSGRATWDERGNSIWEWQTAPGVYSREISPQQLQALEANLCLMDGIQHDTQAALWSRNARGKVNARVARATELVMPVRVSRPAKGTGFDYFLKRIGLPA